MSMQRDPMSQYLGADHGHRGWAAYRSLVPGDPAVNDKAALQELQVIFPADAQQTAINPGHNSSASANQNGTCEDAVFTSHALGAAVTQVLPSWTGDTNKATATLYSGGSADGSESTFQSGSVRQALVGLHDSGPDPNGC